MNTYTFKSNINCMSCIRSISHSLDQAKEISSWEVDTFHDDKLLTVQTENTPEIIEKIVADAGFEATYIPA